jgi:hydroxymethylpyrimidine pyrophosphatase-like HAD family hydrolase
LKHPFKLLVVDIDGTLVNKTGIISPKDDKALAKVCATGIPRSLCAGRSAYM